MLPSDVVVDLEFNATGSDPGLPLIEHVSASNTSWIGADAALKLLNASGVSPSTRTAMQAAVISGEGKTISVGETAPGEVYIKVAIPPELFNRAGRLLPLRLRLGGSGPSAQTLTISSEEAGLYLTRRGPSAAVRSTSQIESILGCITG